MIAKAEDSTVVIVLHFFPFREKVDCFHSRQQKGPNWNYRFELIRSDCMNLSF